MDLDRYLVVSGIIFMGLVFGLIFGLLGNTITGISYGLTLPQFTYILTIWITLTFISGTVYISTLIKTYT